MTVANGTKSHEFFIGDIVVLNSGGPDMTVVCVYHDTDEVFCKWSSNGGTTYATFHARTIRPITFSE